MNKRTHILTGALAAVAVLLLGAASTSTGLSAWKTQVGVQAALSLQDGRQIALQEAALTVYRPAVQAEEQTPAQTPEANAAEEPAAQPEDAPEPEASAAPEPAATAQPEDNRPAEETGEEPGTAEEAADAPAEPLALAAPMNAESNAELTTPEPEVMGEAGTEPAQEDEQQPEALEPKSNAAETPKPLESAESQTNESTATEPPASEPAEPALQAAAPEGNPVEVSQPQGLCAEYPEVALQPGGWAEYQVVLVNEGTADAALPELEIPDLPEGISCESPELPESGLLRAGERWTLTWIVHCEGESRTVAFSVTACLPQPLIAPAPSAAYTIAPGSGREEETP